MVCNERNSNTFFENGVSVCCDLYPGTLQQGKGAKHIEICVELLCSTEYYIAVLCTEEEVAVERRSCSAWSSF